MFKLFRLTKRSAKPLASTQHISINQHGVLNSTEHVQGCGISIRGEGSEKFLLIIGADELPGVIARLQAVHQQNVRNGLMVADGDAGTGWMRDAHKYVDNSVKE